MATTIDEMLRNMKLKTEEDLQQLETFKKCVSHCDARFEEERRARYSVLETIEEIEKCHSEILKIT